jgi:hypothetical protein
MNATEMVDRWCILRTSGARTIPLARSLVDAGIEAWTPINMTSRRRPRSKVRVEREAPIAPTFVFARACHLAELARMRMLPCSPHPGFSIFRHAGRIPLVSDLDMSGMRAVEDSERRKILRKQRQPIVIGQELTPTTGGFAGMTGIVEDAEGRYAIVNFGGWMRGVKVDSWLLDSTEIETPAAPHWHRRSSGLRG